MGEKRTERARRYNNTRVRERDGASGGGVAASARRRCARLGEKRAKTRRERDGDKPLSLPLSFSLLYAYIYAANTRSGERERAERRKGGERREREGASSEHVDRKRAKVRGERDGARCPPTGRVSERARGGREGERKREGGRPRGVPRRGEGRRSRELRAPRRRLCSAAATPVPRLG